MQFDLTTLYSGKTGELLKRHLDFQVSELDKVSDIEETDPVKFGTKAMIRQGVIIELKKILKLTDPVQEIEPPKSKTKRYGLQD